MKPQNIVKHEFVYESTGTMQVCLHCPGMIGQGFSPGACIERFDEEKFKSWLDFHNYSLVENEKRKTVRYVKRFSNDIRTYQSLLKEYEKSLKIHNHESQAKGT